jgi:hypothetical protein
MQKKGIFIRVTAAVCLMVVASCSLTSLDAVWKDPQYQSGKLKSVLVIGGSTNQVVRRIFEDEFTARFKTRGTNAIPSYRIFPDENSLDKDAIDAKSQDLGIDALLIARVVDRKIKRELTPAPYSNYYQGTYFYDWPHRYSRYYSGPYPLRYDDERPRLSEYEVVNLETNIYDTRTGKLIWSALSNTIVGGSSKLEISSIIDTIMKSLSENQLIN